MDLLRTWLESGPVVKNGKVYLLDRVVEIDDHMAARFPSQNWAPIALADGKLLNRNQARMMCVRVAEFSLLGFPNFRVLKVKSIS